MNRGITLLEMLVVVVVICILAALALSLQRSTRHPHHVTSCANNLSQMWKMQNVYMSRFGGPMKAMPEATGQTFWRALTTTQPPLIDPTVYDIFICPVLGTSRDGDCDYAGPSRRMNQIADGDPVGADLPENHKEDAKGPGSGNVLRKSGDVLEVTGPDWAKLMTDPNFPVR